MKEMYTLYEVYLGLDLDAIVMDETYQRVLMTKLLQQKRIMEYIKRDEYDDDYASCYIGEVQPIKKYNKYGDYIGTEYNIIFNEHDNKEIEEMLKKDKYYDKKMRINFLRAQKKSNEKEAR